MGLKIGNKNITLTTNKTTTPSLVFTKGSQKLYGALLNKKPSYPTIYIDKKYLTSVDVAFGSHSYDINIHCYGSNPNYSGWALRQLVSKHGFINGVKFSVYMKLAGGNYDGMGFQAYIYNKYDHSKQIYLTQGWGAGNNWWWDQSYSYTLTSADLEKLGGPNTELEVEARIWGDNGNAELTIIATFTLETY